MKNISNKIKKSISEKAKKGFKPENSNPEYIEIMDYGIECFTQNIFKIYITLLLATGFKILIPVLSIALFYGLLRAFSFGIHLKKSSTCFLWGLILYIGGGFLVTYINISTELFIFLFILCSGIYVSFAPSGSLQKPIGKKDYIKDKIIIIFILSVYLNIYLIFNNNFTNNIILFSMAAQAVNIHPYTYKIFKQAVPQLVEQHKIDCIKKYPILSKENFYEIKRLFKNKEFQLMFSVCLAIFFINLAVVNAGQVYTVAPWYHNEPKLPKTFKNLL